MDLEKKKVFLINTAYWAVIALFAVLGIKYVLPVFLPFLFGLLAAYLVVWITIRLNCPNRWLRLGLALVLYLGVGALLGFLTYKGVDLLGQLADFLPVLYEKHLVPIADRFYGFFGSLLQSLDPDITSLLDKLSDALISGISKLVSLVSRGLVNLVSSAATGVPATLFSIITMIFCTIFVVVDWDRIQVFAQANLPEKAKQILEQIRDYLTGTLFVVLRSYMLIMLITFLELSILFAVFGIEHAVMKAAVIAVLDILPLLGTGGIMIPWIIVSMIMGNFAMGVKLIIIYVVVTLVRNYIEPKIVGAQLGLHPIITLVSMFVGLRFFGFFGLFGLPVAISFFWKQHKAKAEKKARETAAASPEPETSPSEAGPQSES